MARSNFYFATAIVASVLFSSFANARTFRIFEVRKNLQLTDNEPVIHDYYLNAGSSQGLRAGMTIPVQRKEAVHDFYGDNEDDLVVTVGRLKLISVQANISVGRLIAVTDSRKLASAPVLDFETVMIGDRVDIAGATGEEADSGQGGTGSGQHGNGIGSNGSAPGAGLGEAGSLAANPVATPDAATAVAPTQPKANTAPAITMEPMGPAPKSEPKRAVANVKESVPKLELRSPDEFKNVSEESGSLMPDETAPEVNVR